jgi:hypothetical protein
LHYRSHAASGLTSRWQVKYRNPSPSRGRLLAQEVILDAATLEALETSKENTRSNDRAIHDALCEALKSDGLRTGPAAVAALVGPPSEPGSALSRIRLAISYTIKAGLSLPQVTHQHQAKQLYGESLAALAQEVAIPGINLGKSTLQAILLINLSGLAMDGFDQLSCFSAHNRAAEAIVRQIGRDLCDDVSYLQIVLAVREMGVSQSRSYKARGMLTILDTAMFFNEYPIPRHHRRQRPIPIIMVRFPGRLHRKPRLQANTPPGPHPRSATPSRNASQQSSLSRDHSADKRANGPLPASRQNFVHVANFVTRRLEIHRSTLRSAARCER